MSDIKERLKRAYDRIVYPTAMGDVPIQLAKMAKYERLPIEPEETTIEYDENGEEIINEIEEPIEELMGEEVLVGYYSINELANLLGDEFIPIPFNKSGSLMSIKWAFDKRIAYDAEGNELTDGGATRKLLLANGLVNMLDGKEAYEIEVENLLGNEFGIFGNYEFSQVRNKATI